jgi:hypothetical protein
VRLASRKRTTRAADAPRGKPGVNQSRHSGSRCIAHASNNLPGDIEHFVESVNDWYAVNYIPLKGKLDFKNYIHGHIKYAFKFVLRDPNSEFIDGRDQIVPPFDFSLIAERNAVADSDVGTSFVDTGQMLKGYCRLIYRWDQQPVFIHDIQGFDEVERCCPSKFTERAHGSEGVAEPVPNLVGLSLLNHFVEPLFLLTKRKLDSVMLPLRTFRRNDFPVGMIESGAEVVDRIATKQSGKVHDRFVLFTQNGALAGLCICFENNYERSPFAEKFIEISDVFSGPIELEQRAVCHGKTESLNSSEFWAIF